MRTDTHRGFEKAWKKLSHAQRSKAMSAIRQFASNPNDPHLRLHQLKGKYHPQYSISAGGDLRIHFLQLDNNTIVLMLIGTHAQLY